MGRLASFGPVELKDGAITSSKLAPGALANQTIGLNDGAITASKLAAGALANQTIGLNDGAITASKLAAGALANQTIGLNDGAITASKLAAGALANQTIGLNDGAITASKLAPGALANQTIGLNDGAITNTKIADSAIQDNHFVSYLGPFIISWAPSAVPRTFNDTEKSTTAITPTKRKEIKFNQYVGKIDVYFELKSGDGVHLAFAQIYINGNPVGTQRSTNSSTYQGYDQEIGPLNPNDLLQIYVWQEAGGSGAYVRNMRLCYSYGVTYFGVRRLANPMFFAEDGQVPINVTIQDPA